MDAVVIGGGGATLEPCQMPKLTSLAGLDVNFNSPEHCSSRDGSFIQDEDMHLILEFGPQKRSILSGIEDGGPPTNMITSSWRCRNAEWANNFDADVAQLDFDDFSAVRDMAQLRGARYKVDFENVMPDPNELHSMNHHHRRIVDPQDVVDALRQQQQREKQRNRQKCLSNRRRMMKNSMEVSLFELSEDGSSLFSSDECYGANGNSSLNDDEDDADQSDGGVDDFSDKLIGRGDDLSVGRLDQRLVAAAAQIPAFISTDSLDYSTLSIGEEQLRAACATNKREYVLTFDKNAFESGLAILSTMDVDNSLTTAADNNKDANDNNIGVDKEIYGDKKNDEILTANEMQITEENHEDVNNANVLTNREDIFDPDDRTNDIVAVDNELTTWERVKRSYEMPSASAPHRQTLYHSKCTSLPNVPNASLLLSPRGISSMNNNNNNDILLIRQGGEEKLASTDNNACYSTNNDNGNNTEVAPFSLLKAFQQQNAADYGCGFTSLANFKSHVTNENPLNHVTVSNESSGYVTGTGSQVVANNSNLSYYNHTYRANANNNANANNLVNINNFVNSSVNNQRTRLDSNLLTFVNNTPPMLNDDTSNNAELDECTNRIFQKLMNNNRPLIKPAYGTENDQDYEYAEFFINGRYIDMNHNEIGFVPPPEGGTDKDAYDHMTSNGDDQSAGDMDRREQPIRNEHHHHNVDSFFTGGAFKAFNGNSRRLWSTTNQRRANSLDVGPPAKPPRTFATLLEQRQNEEEEEGDDESFSSPLRRGGASPKHYYGKQPIRNDREIDVGQSRPPKHSATQVPVYVADQSVQTVQPDNGRLVTAVNRSLIGGGADSSSFVDSMAKINAIGGKLLSPRLPVVASLTNQNRSPSRLPDLNFLRFPFKVPPLGLSMSPFLLNFLGGSPTSPPTSPRSRDFLRPPMETSQSTSAALNFMKLGKNFNFFTNSYVQQQHQLPSAPKLLASEETTALNNALPPQAATANQATGSNSHVTGSNHVTGPSHVQDWDSLATLLPKDVVQACMFFKENANYLRNIDKPHQQAMTSPRDYAMSHHQSANRKFQYFQTCKKLSRDASSAANQERGTCSCKKFSSSNNTRRFDRIEENDDDDEDRNDYATHAGSLHYCCSHFGAGGGADQYCPGGSTCCSPTWCHYAAASTICCQRKMVVGGGGASATPCCCCSASHHSEPLPSCRRHAIGRCANQSHGAAVRSSCCDAHVCRNSRDLCQSRDASQSRHVTMSQSNRCCCSSPPSLTNQIFERECSKCCKQRQSKTNLKEKMDLDVKDDIEFENNVKSLTVLVEQITRYCNEVVQIYVQSANEQVDGYNNINNSNAVIGTLIFDSLCPSLETLIGHGLCGGKNVMNVVQTSVSSDSIAQSVYGLVIGLNGTEGKRRENSLQFAVFVNNLLNLRSFDAWLTDLIHSEKTLRENYASPSAYLRLLGSKPCVNLYDSMMTSLKRMTSSVPFDAMKLIDVQISVASNNNNINSNDDEKLESCQKLKHSSRTTSLDVDESAERKGFSCTVVLQKELRIIFRFPSSYTASVCAVAEKTQAEKSSSADSKNPDIRKRGTGSTAVQQSVPAKLASDSRIPTNSSSVLSKFRGGGSNNSGSASSRTEIANDISPQNSTTNNDILTPGVNDISSPIINQRYPVDPVMSPKSAVSADSALKLSSHPIKSTPPQTPKKSKIPLMRSNQPKPSKSENSR